MTDLIQAFFSFLEESPTPFHAVAAACRRLEKAGFLPLHEADLWKLEPGGKYYVTRNLSSCIAFRLPESGPPRSFLLSASHGDSPSFRIKEGGVLFSSHYARLNTEPYGGALFAPWFDRPLSVAGKLLVRQGDRLETRLVDLKRPVAVIPNLAIHMNRKANAGVAYAPQTDLLPLLGGREAGEAWREAVAGAAGVKPEEIVGEDLQLYLPERCRLIGLREEYLCGPRLDDLLCAYGTLRGLLDARRCPGAAVYCLFDSEEIGSMTRQGGGASFLSDLMLRIADSFAMDAQQLRAALAQSLMLSADNVHAWHPNHPELSDPENSVTMNGGLVIKHSASRRYASDAVSAALLREICRRAQVPVQNYSNRSDIPGGATLSAIANARLSMPAVDVGLAQLAMHSCCETAGAGDLLHLARAARAFFQTGLRAREDGVYLLED